MSVKSMVLVYELAYEWWKMHRIMSAALLSMLIAAPASTLNHNNLSNAEEMLSFRLRQIGKERLEIHVDSWNVAVFMKILNKVEQPARQVCHRIWLLLTQIPGFLFKKQFGLVVFALPECPLAPFPPWVEQSHVHDVGQLGISQVGLVNGRLASSESVVQIDKVLLIAIEK